MVVAVLFRVIVAVIVRMLFVLVLMRVIVAMRTGRCPQQRRIKPALHCAHCKTLAFQPVFQIGDRLGQQCIGVDRDRPATLNKRNCQLSQLAGRKAVNRYDSLQCAGHADHHAVRVDQHIANRQMGVMRQRKFGLAAV